MANTGLGQRIRDARSLLGWSQARLASELCTAAGRDTLTRHDISRWESGARVPVRFWAPWVHRVIGVSVSDEDTERVRQAVDGSVRVDTSALDALCASLAAQRRIEDILGAGHVLEPVRASLGVVESLAQEAPEAHRRSAVGLLSELHQYTGWLYLATGQERVARSYLDRAVVAGVEASDDERTATAMSFGAYRWLCLGDLHSAAALTESAGKLATGSQRTYNAFQLAEVYARMGSRQQALDQLKRAEREVASLPAPEELGNGEYWYTPEFFQGNTAYVLGYLGEVESARRLMRESLEAMPTEWSGAEWAAHRRAFAAG